MRQRRPRTSAGAVSTLNTEKPCKEQHKHREPNLWPRLHHTHEATPKDALGLLKGSCTTARRMLAFKNGPAMVTKLGMVIGTKKQL